MQRQREAATCYIFGIEIPYEEAAAVEIHDQGCGVGVGELGRRVEAGGD